MRTLKWLFCSSIFLAGFTTAALGKPEPMDGILAIVNDSIITKNELKNQVRIIEQQFHHNGNPTPEREVLEKQVLEHLIVNEIQLQLAKRTGIQVDENTLDNTIENIAKQNHLTVSQLREAVAKEGADFSQYRNNIRQQMIISHLQHRDLMHEVQVSDQEVNQFLQSPNGLGSMTTEYRLGHILIPLAEAPSPEELKKAEERSQRIIAKLRAGADFSQLAVMESSGELALKGGDLGWRKLPELPTIFVKAVPSLKVNDIPEPIRSSSGYHVIKLLDKRSAAETQATVDKTLVRHILLKTNATTSDQDAKQRLTELREKIVKGEDFTKLAKAHSVDLGSASNGGSLGWVSKEVLVPEFSQVMESLALQELSQPFKTSFGWHIMEVMDRRSVSSDDASLKQKAKEMIQQRKYEEKLQAWIRQLREEAYVKLTTESEHG